MDKRIPDSDQKGEYRGADLNRAVRAAAARLGGCEHLDFVIDKIAKINTIQGPPSPPPKMLRLKNRNLPGGPYRHVLLTKYCRIV